MPNSGGAERVGKWTLFSKMHMQYPLTVFYFGYLLIKGFNQENVTICTHHTMNLPLRTINCLKCFGPD